MNRQIEAGILPLANLVLFPKSTIFLTIKEPRQIEIILNFIRQEIPIAMPLFINSNFFATCTRAKVVVIKQNGADVTSEGLKLFVSGIDKVQLQIPTLNNPHIYFISSLTDNNKEDKGMEPLLTKLRVKFENWIDKCVPLQDERDYLRSQTTTPEGLTYNIAMYMIDDLITKQRCLEIDSLTERVLMLWALLEKESATLAKQALALFDAA